MEFLNSGLVPALWALMLLIAVLCIASRLGAVLLGLAGYGNFILKQAEGFIFSCAVGIIVISLGVWLLGLLGWLGRMPVLFFLAVCLIIPARFPKKGILFFRGKKESNARDWEKWLCAAMGVVFFLSCLQALSPPTGNDALAYHLYHPKEFVLHHRIFSVPYEREALWPYQTEMLFTLGLLLQGTMLAQLFHWVFYVLTALAVYVFGKRFYGRSAAAIAATVFAFCPAAFAQSGQAYVDLSLAFYTFLAVYVFCLRDVLGERRSVVLSGVFCGGALATKYLALSSAAALSLLWLLCPGRRFRNLFLFVTASAFIAGGWYLRSWVIAGNPVYPFFSEIFGQGFSFDAGAGVGMGNGVVDFLKFGWNLSMHPGAFGGEILGPLFLLFLPLLLLFMKKPGSRAFYLSFFSVLYIFLLFHQSQQARFYLSVAPILSVGVGVALSHVMARKGVLQKIAVTVFSTVLFLHMGIFLYRVRNNWRVVFGFEDTTSYLLRFERSFKGFLYFRDHAKPEERIFNFAEVRHFYNENPAMFHCTPAFRAELRARNQSIADYLDKNYFDYLWFREDTEYDLVSYAHSHGYRTVYSYESREGAGVFHYLLFQRSS